MPQDSKSDLRLEIKGELNAMSDEQRHDASLAACNRMLTLDCFRHASIIMLYMPLATEVDVTSIALRCFQENKTVCVPRVDWKRRDMVPVEVTTFDDHVMEVDQHGIRVPKRCRPVPPAFIDLAIIPGLAFDTDCNRLGRGGGYYDRFLRRLPQSATTIGIGFDQQIVPLVPADGRDIPLHMVVTDRRCCSRRTSPQQH